MTHVNQDISLQYQNILDWCVKPKNLQLISNGGQLHRRRTGKKRSLLHVAKSELLVGLERAPEKWRQAAEVALFQLKHLGHELAEAFDFTGSS